MYNKTWMDKICHTYTVEYLTIRYGVNIDTCYNIDEPQSSMLIVRSHSQKTSYCIISLNVKYLE